MTKCIGIVKWYNEGKGYGFIQADDVTDVFVHYTAISGTGYKTLAEGQCVAFELCDSSHGSQAVNVEKVDLSPEGELV